MLTAVLQDADRRFGLAALGGASVLVAVWPLSILNTQGTILQPSLWKVPRDQVAVAWLANRLTPEGRRVLAPEAVASWIPVAEDHAAPVFVRNDYIDQSTPVAQPFMQIDARKSLAAWIDGKAELDGAQLSRLLDELCVGLVVRPEAQGAPPFEGETLATESGYLFVAPATTCS